MKVLVAIALVLASASARGSGPYLPSGWRPEGPAFFLPSEARKPVVTPLKDAPLEGSVASGSNSLREYGPPNLQSLPDVATEQSFVVIDVKFGQEGANVETATEVISEVKSALVQELSATTESQAVEEVTAAIETVEGKSLNLEVEAVDETAVTTQEDVEATTQAIVGAVEESVSAKIQTEVAEEVKTVEGVKNIAEAIISLEKEVVAQNVQISQDIIELKSIEQTSGDLAQLPEGFLEYGPPGFKEYGPPGFKEYGPPQEDALPRNDEAKAEQEKFDNNETRKRRFSPKFRSSKKH